MNIKLVEKGHKNIPDFIGKNYHLTATVIAMYITDVMPDVRDYIKVNKFVYLVRERFFDADANQTFLFVENQSRTNTDL